MVAVRTRDEAVLRKAHALLTESLVATLVMAVSALGACDRSRPEGTGMTRGLSDTASADAPSRSLLDTLGFQWTTEQSRPAVWDAVRSAFANELSDTVRGVYLPLGIERVGLHGSYAIAVIRYELPSVPEAPVFRLYSYDLEGGRKSIIAAAAAAGSGRDLWLAWEFERLAQFDSTRRPDVVFRHRDCFECEAVEWLSAVYLEPGVGWQLRNWSGTGDHVLVGSQVQYGIGRSTYACAHRIWDLDHDGSDELVAHCRITHSAETSDSVISLRDSVMLFEVAGGRAVSRSVTQPEEQSGLLRALCEGGSDNVLCRSQP